MMPNSLLEHLRVGPVFLGESEHAIVELFGSAGQKGGNENRAFLMYTDGYSVVLLNFDSHKRLARIVINPGPLVQKRRLPPGIPRIDLWRWEGGKVSKPATNGWLQGNKFWSVFPGKTRKWIFHGHGCTGLAAYYNYGKYTFEMGPLVRKK